MNSTRRPNRQPLLLLVAMLLSACGGDGDHSASGTSGGGAAGQGQSAESAGESGMLDVPPDVAKNLGVEFATAERRAVREILRVPGRIELTPAAIREHRVAVEGRVRLHTRQYQAVRAGDPLLTIESPSWRQMQHETVEAEGEIEVARAMLEVAAARREETDREISVLDERVRALRDAGSRNASLEADRAIAETRVPRLLAEHNAARVQLAEAREHLQSRTRMLSAVSGIPLETLLAKIPAAGDQRVARYRTIEDLTHIAEVDGIVETITITEGGWLAAGGLALTIIRPDLVRFRGDAPMRELPTHAIEDAAVKLVPPIAGPTAVGSWTGAFVRAPVADPHTRRIPVYLNLAPGDRPAWIHPGAQAFLEIDRGTIDSVRAAGELPVAIPRSALVRDGLRTFFYVRNPDDPDHLHEVAAKLGADDGWYVEILSGLEPGREVVVRGASTLNLAGGGGSAQQKAPPGFHYHADGTLHPDH